MREQPAIKVYVHSRLRKLRACQGTRHLVCATAAFILIVHEQHRLGCAILYAHMGTYTQDKQYYSANTQHALQHRQNRQLVCKWYIDKCGAHTMSSDNASRPGQCA